MERVRKGWFLRVNPFNKGQRSVVSLAPEDVDLFCFWSKNPHPLLNHLDELDGRGYRYYVQFTLNPYDTLIEPNLPPHSERIETFRRLAGRLGSRRVIWRYDPVILSSHTPVPWHEEWMEKLAGALTGGTTRVVISFCDFPPGVRSRLEGLRKTHGIVVDDLASPERVDERTRFCRQATAIAARYGMEIVSCAEDLDLRKHGILPGRCIDPLLIEEITGIGRGVKKDRYQRRHCGCVESIDMGRYGTCGHGCVYCYARRSSAPP
jgi:DNA repair photolyase